LRELLPGRFVPMSRVIMGHKMGALTTSGKSAKKPRTISSTVRGLAIHQILISLTR
jgi:hypothetical protein